MKLFEPGCIGRLQLKNRIIMAPMGAAGLVEFDGRFSPRAIDYYAARARGGTGLITTGLAYVTRELEPAFHGPIIDEEKYTARLNELAEAVHDYGAKLAIQLTAGLGRVAPLSQIRRVGAIAPSAVPCHFDPTITARELTTAEVEKLVRAFETAARIVCAAGVDAINLHAHEGYLFDQFQTALWNKRTDKYGGDLTARLRFATEVIAAIKRGAGADFPIIYRFGLTHYLPGGREIEEGLEIARRMEAVGVDALEVDAGGYETWHWPHPTTYEAHGCMVDLAARVKKIVKIPVIAVGKLGYPELAECTLADGKADFISLGRPLLADPDWPNKVKAGKLEDIRPCLGESEGCSGRLRQGRHLSCTVNPTVGMERDLALTPAPRRKGVLVVGGGPAGMEAARVCALRGHNVTLWEKSNVLGGNLIAASAPDFKEDYRKLMDYLSRQIEKLGVSIEFSKEATPELVLEARPDAVFVATGSTPIIPDIAGIENAKVATAPEVLLGNRETGQTVVIIGGGLVGCETALFLVRQGKKVTVIEVLDTVAENMFMRDRVRLLELLAEAKVKIMTGTLALAVAAKGVAVANRRGEKSLLPATSVVLATGFQSNNRLQQELADRVPELYPIGDCVQPRKVINAIWEGYRTARLV